MTSPALQVGQLVQVSDSAGAYKFVDLPAGTYRLRAELTGFSSSIREDLRLTVGFNARIDLTLKLGAMEESVTVSGQSPVVDVTSTTASVAFTKEVLDAIPRGRDLQNVFAMAPGVTQAVADVGGSTMAQRQNLSSYGVLSQPKLQVEGMNITMGADQNTAIYFNDSTLEEVQIKSSGNDAEVSVPGISMVAIMKSGGNDFHGTYQVSAQSPRLQADNLNDALRAQGLTATSPLKNFYDLSADLGGRVIRDKLWFYGAYGRQSKNEGLLGFASGPGPDGKYLTADDPLANVETSLSQMSAKLSYQLTKNNRLVYAWQRGTKAQPQNNADRFTPLESTQGLQEPDRDSEDRAPEHDQSARARERRRRLQRLRDRLRCGPLVRTRGCAAPAGPRDDVEHRLGAAASEQDPRSLSDRRQHQLLPGALVRRQARVQDRHQHLSRQELRRLFEQPGLQLHPLHRYDRRCPEYAVANQALQHAGRSRRPRQHLRVVLEGQLAGHQQADDQSRRPLRAAALVPAGAGLSRARAIGRRYSRPAPSSKSRCRSSPVRCLAPAWPGISAANRS